jgi:hypothetical protein
LIFLVLLRLWQLVLRAVAGILFPLIFSLPFRRFPASAPRFLRSAAYSSSSPRTLSSLDSRKAERTRLFTSLGACTKPTCTSGHTAFTPIRPPHLGIVPSPEMTRMEEYFAMFSTMMSEHLFEFVADVELLEQLRLSVKLEFWNGQVR